jgi:predicted RecB family nuclease
MKLDASGIRLSATDLSNRLACRHLTALDLQVAHGQRQKPDWAAPDLAVIQELGRQHEAAYLDHLAKHKGIAVTNLADIKSETTLVEETRKLMSQGAEIIAQGALTDGKWFGRPDVLRRVAKPSPKWAWSYEVADTKLALDTKAATILQISLHSELLGKAQGCEPETMRVIPPGKDFDGEPYRVAEYAAYFRYVKARLERVTQDGSAGTTYPEPVPHCDVCRWFRQCDDRRRRDDHLSLVAGIRSQQRNQLEAWDTDTMAKLAALPIPIKKRPDHGSREAIEHIREQARVQVQGRTENKLVHETLLPVVEETGLCRLPEPSPNDLFLDLEGDPFAGESGMQYLFGFAAQKTAASCVTKSDGHSTANRKKSLRVAGR